MNKFKFWKSIWDKKGNSKEEDLLYLDGYEHLDYDFSSVDICSKIKEMINIEDEDKVLEVGCAAGFLSQNFKNYVGVDYSLSLLKKNKSFFDKKVINCEADNLPFEIDSFDKSFVFGVFQYFPNLKYASKVIEEMKRVTKGGIFIGDIKRDSLQKKHTNYTRKWFIERGFSISKCFYDPYDRNRFNAYMEIEC